MRAGTRHVGTGRKDRDENSRGTGPVDRSSHDGMTHWQSSTTGYSSETKAVGNGPPRVLRVHSIPEKIDTAAKKLLAKTKMVTLFHLKYRLAKKNG